MKKDLLFVGAIFAAAGGVTALAIKTIKKHKEESREEQALL